MFRDCGKGHALKKNVVKHFVILDRTTLILIVVDKKKINILLEREKKKINEFYKILLFASATEYIYKYIYIKYKYI